MLSKKMEEALNQQINAEMYSSYLYLAMAAHFQTANFTGFAHWMRVQAKEEEGHAMKIYDYILERNGKIALKAVEAPPAKLGSPLKVFEETYKHEQTVTARIHKLAELAGEERDHATAIFLQWFINEQVEEEAQANLIYEQLKMIGEDHIGGIFMLDHRVGKRE
jgi:ferritin